MKFYDHHLIFNTMPQNWSTSKELGVAAATLNAMVREGIIEVDRTRSPMKYRPIIETGAKQKILDLIEKYSDPSFHICLKYIIGSIERLIYNGEWFSDFSQKEINDAICSYVKQVIVFHNGIEIINIELN